jgi:hypothetical protein
MVDTAIPLSASDRARVQREIWDVIALEAQISDVSQLFPFITYTHNLFAIMVSFNTIQCFLNFIKQIVFS